MAKPNFHWQWIVFYCEIFGLAIVIGGLLMIMASVIPAVFNSFGMEPAGRFLRRVFDGYTQITMGVVIFLFGTGTARFWLGRVSKKVWLPVTPLEGTFLIAMGCITVLIAWVVGPQAVALQELAFEAATETEKNAAFNDFFRMHMVVRALHLTNLGLAIGLFIYKLRKGLTWRISI